MAQLECVPEQHETIDVTERGQERRALAGAAQDVRAATGAQVQVGDDEGAQGRWPV
jgi:hypothetical protein